MSAGQFDALLGLTARVVAAARTAGTGDAASALEALAPLLDWQARQRALDALRDHLRDVHHIHSIAALTVRDRADFADLMTIVAAGLAALRPLWQRFDSSWSEGWLAQGREFERRCARLARLCVEIDLLRVTLAALDARRRRYARRRGVDRARRIDIRRRAVNEPRGTSHPQAHFGSSENGRYSF